MTASHALKLGRAEKHLEDLEAWIEAWRDPKPYAVRVEDDPQPPYKLVKVKPQPIPQDPVALLIGDCLFNLRSALDNLVYELALAYTIPLPAEAATDSEFPIFGDVDRSGKAGTGATRFKSTGRGGGLSKIRAIDPSARADIEQMQPYQRGNAYTSDPLWILHELNRIDKHRLLHFGFFGFSGVGIDTRKTRNASIVPGILESFGGLVEEDEAVVARVPLAAVNPSQDMHVEFLTEIHVAFASSTTVAAKEPVAPILRDLHRFVVNDVMLPLAKYL